MIVVLLLQTLLTLQQAASLPPSKTTFPVHAQIQGRGVGVLEDGRLVVIRRGLKPLFARLISLPVPPGVSPDAFFGHVILTTGERTPNFYWFGGGGWLQLEGDGPWASHGSIPLSGSVTYHLIKTDGQRLIVTPSK